jgi:hypothetical protein
LGMYFFAPKCGLLLRPKESFMQTIKGTCHCNAVEF